MRIAIAGISVENSNFTSLPTTEDDFRTFRGNELLQSGRYPFLAELDSVTGEPIEWVPIFFARALPGGPLEPDAYHHFRAEIVERLASAGPVDGLYLDLHGAMYVEGMQDAEGDLARAVREVIGQNPLIAASMDLHGNITHDFVGRLNIVTAYRTAPHRDTEETRQRACRLLVEALAEKERPHVICIPIPVLLSGEQTRTDMEPGASLWAALDGTSQKPGVLDASLFVGFAWVDERRSHAAAVVSGTDPAAMRAVARTVAQSYWEARTRFHFGVQSGTIDECIRHALEAPGSPVFISDSGDNVTAGAPGDLPLVLERLIAYTGQGLPSALVGGLADAQAVAACRSAGIGAKVALSLGGKLDTVHAKPLEVEALVKQIIPAKDEDGDRAVIEIGPITVILTAWRQAFTDRDAFAAVGIDPSAYKIVVVKLGYLFPDLQRIASLSLMALSPGASDLDLERLPYRQIERPMFPIDKEFSWKPE